MIDYEPPFKITSLIIKLCADISYELGKIANFESLSRFPKLRKQNRINSIYSSCAIEANSLSFDDVHDIINGVEVFGPKKEILEVKNAINAYEKLEDYDPFNLDDLLLAHKILTKDLISKPGQFRLNNEGVFSGNKCIFMAPPQDLVPGLMKNLFSYLNNNKDDVHLLILSSVFHYEFVYIHPFQDGNGRTARLWQTAILGKFNPIFYRLPLENFVKEYQEEYYKVIDECNEEGESTKFIEFMLKMILKTLKNTKNNIDNETLKYDFAINKLLKAMEYDIPYTAKELMDKLNLSSISGFKRTYLNPALKIGAISYELKDKITSKNQRYIKFSKN